MILLIHPPIVRPSEPPPGLAVLAGTLQHHHVAFDVLDANLEGIWYLLKNFHGLTSEVRGKGMVRDTWTGRAYRHLHRNLSWLTSPAGYTNMSLYSRAVRDVQRILEKSSHSKRTIVSLANYSDARFSPLRSADLAYCAENHQESPFYAYFQERLSQLIEERQPDWVGFSLNYLSQALCTFSMMGFLKRQYPSLRIVLGGGLVTSWMRRPRWRDSFHGLVDAWIAGPAEQQLLALLENRGGNLRRAPSYDSFVSRSDAEQFSHASYLSPGFILPYSASSGCYWGKCSFCPERAERNPYRPVSSNDLIRELGELTSRTAPVLIHLVDNALSPLHLAALAKHPPGAPWYGFTRVTPELADQDFCLALKQSGCVMLQLGLESGDQAVLDALNKGIKLETSSGVLRAMENAGIASYVYLLFGTPAETHEAARHTLRFAAAHASLISFLNLAIFNLPAFGPDTAGLDTEEFYDGDLLLYRSFHHPAGWHRNNVRQFLDREFRRHPAIAPILRRDPPVFTSSHAPFFVGANTRHAFPGLPKPCPD